MGGRCTRKILGFVTLSAWLAGELACVAEEPLDCDLESATVELCGRTVSYFKLCKQGGPPAVSSAMIDERDKHSEMIGEEAVFGCTSRSAGGDCKANSPREADTVVKKTLDTFEKSRDSSDGQRAFHDLVTAAAFENARDDAAQVASKGFTRDITSEHLLYLAHDHKRFHADAEGVNLALAATTDAEKNAQLKLAEIMGDMKAKFEASQDDFSAKSSGLYEQIARSRADVMDAMACDLRQKAAVDRDRENRMKSIGNDLLTSTVTSTGTGTATSTGTSDVTGVGGKLDLPGGTSSGTVEGTSTSTSTSTSSSTESASSTGTSVESGTSTSTDTSEGSSHEITIFNEAGVRIFQEAPDPDLFTRVHRVYREKEERGTFYTTILD